VIVMELWTLVIPRAIQRFRWLHATSVSIPVIFVGVSNSKSDLLKSKTLGILPWILRDRSRDQITSQVSNQFMQFDARWRIALRTGQFFCAHAGWPANRYEAPEANVQQAHEH